MVSTLVPVSARKARTRERFIGAATDLLLRQGRSALSVSAVSRELGVNHSLFYQHFTDMDDCLAAAATQVLDELIPIDRERRRQVLRNLGLHRRATEQHLREALDRWLEHQPFVEMLLSHRLESSPMGQAFAEALEQVRRAYAEDMWELARTLSLPRVTQAMADMTADVQLDHWLWALEVAVRGRAEERTAIAAALADLALASTHAFVARGRVPSYGEQVALSFSPSRRRELEEACKWLADAARGQTDRELIKNLGGGTFSGMIAFMLDAICPFFMPGALTYPALVRYRVSFEDEQGVGLLVIEDGKCRPLTEDPGLPAILTWELSLRTWIESVAGIRDLEECFTSGDIRVEGDLRMASQFVEWFYFPEADLT